MIHDMSSHETSTLRMRINSYSSSPSITYSQSSSKIYHSSINQIISQSIANRYVQPSGSLNSAPFDLAFFHSRDANKPRASEKLSLDSKKDGEKTKGQKEEKKISASTHNNKLN